MKRALITGAAGLVGGCLTQVLLNMGEQYDVYCVLRNENAKKRLSEKLQACGLSIDSVKICFIDLEEFSSVEDMILAVRPDVVFHTAAKVSLSDSNGEDMVRGNLDITHFITDSLLRLRSMGCDPLLIHVSSIAAFGSSDPRGIIDETTPFTDIAHASAYARSKFLSQNDVTRASKLGLRTVIVNPSVIIGINSGLGQMQTLFEMIRRGMPFYTKGSMGYVDARDVASAMIALSESPSAVGEMYCLNGANLTFAEFIGVFGEPFGRKTPKIRVGKIMLGLAHGLTWLWSRVSGGRELLTPAIVSYLTSEARYDGSKVERDAPGFRYRPIEETAHYIANNLTVQK